MYLCAGYAAVGMLLNGVKLCVLVHLAAVTQLPQHIQSFKSGQRWVGEQIVFLFGGHCPQWIERRPVGFSGVL